MPIIVDIPRGIDRVIAAVQQRLPLVFFGTPAFAVPSLRALVVHGWPVQMVVTAPAKPSGRRMLLTPSPVATIAEELGLTVRTPQTLKDETFTREFTDMRPELCVVVAYGKLIPASLLEVPRLGFVNVHPSLLPAYRGAAPVQSAILDGRSETGVSIMLLDDQMDHGPILAAERWRIPSGFDTPACMDELSRIGADLLVTTLDRYAAGTLEPHPQDHGAATYTKKFGRADGRLDWHQPAVMNVNRIRALARNPGTWTQWEGKALAVHHAHAVASDGQNRPGGTVFLHGRDVCVATPDGSVVLETVQLEGGIAVAASAFVNGHPAFVGSVVQ
jgi:methionyl-tRNA formyltransferase